MKIKAEFRNRAGLITVLTILLLVLSLLFSGRNASSATFRNNADTLSNNRNILKPQENSSLLIEMDKAINPPRNLVATALNAEQVKLEWIDESDNETGFKIERAVNRQFTQNTVTFNAPENSSSLIDDTTDRLTTYYYRIKALGAGEESTWSNVTIVLTPDFIPEAPDFLKATSPNPLQVYLTWADKSGNEDGFWIERSTSTNFTENLKIFTSEAGVARCLDTMVPGGKFYYRVCAYNAAGKSDYSNIAEVSVDSKILDEVILYGNQTANVKLSGFSQIFVPFQVDKFGAVLENSIKLNLQDQRGTLEIPKGMRMLNANNRALTSLSYNIPNIVPLPPEGTITLESFEFGPSKSYFIPPGSTTTGPAMTMILKFNPAEVSPNFGANDLKVGVWDGNGWQMITDFTLQKEAGTVTFKASHFTIYSILYTRTKLPSPFSVSDMLITPQYSTVGDKVLIQVVAHNRGVTPGNYSLVLKLNDRVEETRYVSLEPGSSSTEIFTVVDHPAGYYTVDINGLMGHFVIHLSPKSSPAGTPVTTSSSPPSSLPDETDIPFQPSIPSSPPTLWIVIIIATMVLVVLGSLYFLYTRKQR